MAAVAQETTTTVCTRQEAVWCLTRSSLTYLSAPECLRKLPEQSSCSNVLLSLQTPHCERAPLTLPKLTHFNCDLILTLLFESRYSFESVPQALQSLEESVVLRVTHRAMLTEAIGEVYHLCNEAGRRAAVKQHKVRVHLCSCFCERD
jgi:hypothetical protein